MYVLYIHVLHWPATQASMSTACTHMRPHMGVPIAPGTPVGKENTAPSGHVCSTGNTATGEPLFITITPIRSKCCWGSFRFNELLLFHARPPSPEKLFLWFEVLWSPTTLYWYGCALESHTELITIYLGSEEMLTNSNQICLLRLDDAF